MRILFKLGMFRVILIVLVINLIVGGLATEYVVENTMTVIKDKPVDVPFFPCAVVGLFLGEILIPLAILVWFIMLFI